MQLSSTRGPRADYGPRASFLLPGKGISQKYNVLWILKLESLDIIWLKENKFTVLSKILNNYPKL